MKELSEIRELIDKTDDEIKNSFIKSLTSQIISLFNWI